ncbi:hypothetical protein CHELA40_15374 [Chelatococcus asaccharovorans]|nr:hypothetical protein CHELA17_60243 [Chelatococcus asaccharovorans]CAH1682324.1 hypothetical protein CHELA40_15374 [Chelatococcus asaccharovorans]
MRADRPVGRGAMRRAGLTVLETDNGGLADAQRAAGTSRNPSRWNA